MADETGYSSAGRRQALLNQLAKLRSLLIDKNQGLLFEQPHLAEVINAELRDTLRAIQAAEQLNDVPPDSGLLNLTGLGDDAVTGLDEARLPPPLPRYDDAVTSERVLGIADLYYIYQHERVGVFRAVLKLQELFKAGRVRLASGNGALGLYQFDRQRVLRYTRRERLQAYRRVFGYTNVQPAPGSKPNTSFHGLFVNYNTRVARFFRDQRISEVVRPDGRSLTFGSVAVVRRAGLDLRNNLKGASYGHVNVLRVEVLQLLEQAFEILGSEDVTRLFGADDAWDVLEEILRRYLGESTVTSQRSRMAFTGREILRWLAQPDILNEDRVEFEALLKYIADSCEEWLTSTESLGLMSERGSAASGKVVPFRRAMNAV